jgi:hypothetical protein
MALCSQLAALSARRRAAGQDDLTFAPHPGWRDATDLDAMISRAATDTGVTPAELPWLRIATAAKLMELSGYRPFDPDRQDCAFIARALDRDDGRLTAENRSDLARMRAATAARMLRAARVRAALTLAPARLLPQTILRAATGRLYWTKHPH